MSGLDIESFLSRLKAFLHEQWAINHATIEPEVAACAQPELLGRWDKSPPPSRGPVLTVHGGWPDGAGDG